MKEKRFATIDELEAGVSRLRVNRTEPLNIN